MTENEPKPVAWWDRACGGFYLNKESIPQNHLNTPGRIVELYAKDDRKLNEEPA